MTPAVNQDNTNDGSIVIKLTYGADVVPADGRRGDLPRTSPCCGAAPMCAARCLKLGHHGSRTSTDENWLRAVQPQLGIISVGAGNPYGHPHPEVHQRRLTISAFRTFAPTNTARSPSPATERNCV